MTHVVHMYIFVYSRFNLVPLKATTGQGSLFAGNLPRSSKKKRLASAIKILWHSAWTPFTVSTVWIECGSTFWMDVTAGCFFMPQIPFVGCHAILRVGRRPSSKGLDSQFKTRLRRFSRQFLAMSSLCQLS